MWKLVLRVVIDNDFNRKKANNVQLSKFTGMKNYYFVLFYTQKELFWVFKDVRYCVFQISGF